MTSTIAIQVIADFKIYTMDLNLKIIKTRVSLDTIKTRIRLERERIEKERPNALPYIEGAKQSEAELLEAYIVFGELTDHILALSRENAELARRNIYFQQKINDLEHELKFKNVEL